jgi:hypothetical protein
LLISAPLQSCQQNIVHKLVHFTDAVGIHCAVLLVPQAPLSRSHTSGSSDGELSVEKKRRFEEMRKAHYNMRTALQQGKALLSSEDGGGIAGADDGEGEVEGRHMADATDAAGAFDDDGGEENGDAEGHSRPRSAAGVTGMNGCGIGGTAGGAADGERRASRVSWGAPVIEGEGGAGEEGDMEVEHDGDWGDSHRGGKRANVNQGGGFCGGTSSSS